MTIANRRMVDRLIRAEQEWGSAALGVRPAPRPFRDVETHQMRSVHAEKWVSEHGELLAKYTYAECTCGDRFVVRHSGPLTKDEVGWHTDELQDAQDHMGRFNRQARHRIYVSRKARRVYVVKA